MKIYEKVRWITDIQWKSITDFFSKNSRKQIRILKEQLETLKIHYKVYELQDTTLNEFNLLYKDEMWKKDNSKVHDIKGKYSAELWKGILYFLELRDTENTLIWWWIATYRENIFTFAFKTTKSDYIFDIPLKIWIWNLLDYLVFEYGFSLWADYISFWKDRNAYWLLWAKTSLPMTKLSKWLLPYTFDENQLIEVQEEEIHQETLIFSNLDKQGQFLEARLYLPTGCLDEEIKRKYWAILNHQSIKLSIIYF